MFNVQQTWIFRQHSDRILLRVIPLMTAEKTNHIALLYKLSFIKKRSFWHPVMMWCNWVWVRMRDYECSARAALLPFPPNRRYHLVRVCSPRTRWHCGPSTLPLSVASSPVSQNAMRAPTTLLVIALAFRGRFAKLSRLLVNAATWTYQSIDKKAWDVLFQEMKHSLWEGVGCF